MMNDIKPNQQLLAGAVEIEKAETVMTEANSTKERLYDFKVNPSAVFRLGNSWITVAMFAITVFSWALYVLFRSGESGMGHTPFLLMIFFLLISAVVHGLMSMMKQHEQDKKESSSFRRSS